MGRPEKPIDPSGRAVAAFANDLRRLRSQAGNPTYRAMARSALYSPSVLSSAASGHRLPTLQVTLTYVAACGGDREAWRRRWLEVSGGEPAATIRPGGAGLPTRPGPSARQVLPRPAQLPPRPRGSVSRASELRTLGAPSGTPAVICGPAGVGKTELALHYAHETADAMTDGQLYADFWPVAGVSPSVADVLGGFLRALGVPADQLPGAADQRAGLYRSLLAERALVVLFDNVRDEWQIRPLLVEMPYGVTIVVSRNPLLGLRDVRRIRLDVLPRTESIAMIAAVVGDRAEADPQACDRLVELCGDLPLALDIAARKLAAQPDIPLRRVTSRLERPRALLDWLSIGDLSVRESLSSAYQQLDDLARALLHRLVRQCADEPLVWAHGPGPGPAALMVGELVEELAAAGMLRPGDRPGTYRLDPLICAFVADLDPSGALGRWGPGRSTAARPLCRSAVARHPRYGALAAQLPGN